MSYNELLAYASLADVSPEQIKMAIEHASWALGLHYEEVADAMMDVLRWDAEQDKTRRYDIEHTVQGMKKRAS